MFYDCIDLNGIDKWRKSRVFGHCKREIEEPIWRTQSFWTIACCDVEFVRSNETFPNLTTVVSNVEFSDLIRSKILDFGEVHVYIWKCIDVLEIPPYTERMSSICGNHCGVCHFLRHIVEITACIDWKISAYRHRFVLSEWNPNSVMEVFIIPRERESQRGLILLYLTQNNKQQTTNFVIFNFLTFLPKKKNNKQQIQVTNLAQTWMVCLCLLLYFSACVWMMYKMNSRITKQQNKINKRLYTT